MFLDNVIRGLIARVSPILPNASAAAHTIPIPYPFRAAISDSTARRSLISPSAPWRASPRPIFLLLIGDNLITLVRHGAAINGSTAAWVF